MMRLSILILFCLTSCTVQEKPPAQQKGQIATILGAAEQTANEGASSLVFVEQECTKEWVGDSTLTPPPNHRTRVRMTVDQIEASLKKVMGGLEWVKGTKLQWQDKARSLGVPDFMESVREQNQASLLFDKTLGDAARDLCPQLMALEVTKDASERVFLMNVEPTDTFENAAEAIELNLSRLVLLYHGRYFPPESPELEPWMSLVSNGMATLQDPTQTWTALCVALIAHPEFQSY